MSITDELRRMLDERGVEWEDCSNGSTYVEYEGEAWRFDPDGYFDTLCIHHYCSYTPEQAIEATLGRGTCKVDTEESLFLDIQRWHVCGCCGTGFSLWYYTEDGDECEETPHYCPNCGRRVVAGEEA